jgi:hypothetical protein
MNLPIPLRSSIFRHSVWNVCFGFLAASAPVWSQTATDAEDEGVVVLSPFTVQGEQEFGYSSTTTLAGTRLNTKIRDVGSAISVLTKELFNDTGAIDAETVLSYALNMEVSGTQGNYAGAAGSAVQSVDVTESRRNPQANGQRVRGLAKASLTRGFFLTDIPFDDYNTSVITINRGPNSLLFGIGEPGGIIDQGLKSADTRSDFGSVSLRLGERNSMRETFDYNRVLLPDRLAVRLAGVSDKTNYQQRPAYKKDQRFYVAINAVLFENNDSRVLGSTTLRGSFEKGRITGTPPNIIPQTDGLSPWFSVPSYSAAELASLNGGTLPSALNWINDGSFVPKMTVDIRKGSNQGNLANSGRSPWFFNLPITYNDPQAQVASIGLADPSVQGVIGRVRWNRLNPRHPLYKAQVDILSLQPLESMPYTPGYVAPVVQDFNVLDNERMLLSGTTNHVEQEFEAPTIALEQILFDGKAGIELAYDYQTYTNWSQLPYSTARDNALFIDLNESLPNAEPNPNVGRPFMVTSAPSGNGPNITESENVRDSFRATAFHTLDFSDHENLLRHLGRNIFTAFHGAQSIRSESRTYRQSWVDASSATDVATALSSGLDGDRRSVYYVNYVGPSLLGNEFQSLGDVRITDWITNPMAKAGDRYRLTYSNFVTPTINPANGLAVFTDEFEVYHSLYDGIARLQEIDSDVLSWQGYLFDGSIVGMVGWRRDEATNYGGSGNALLPSGEYDSANLNLATTPTVETGETLTKSVVFHLPRRWVELPYGSDLTFHYNESENFSPQGVRRNVRNETLSPPTGETREYGFTVELLDQRLALRLNWFETASTGISTDLGGVIDLVGGGMVADWLLRWREAEISGLTIDEALVQAGGTAGTFASHQAVYDEIIDFLPTEYQAIYNFRFDAPGSQTVLWDEVDGLTATTSFATDGFELELTGSPTPNWSVAFNLGQQETVRTDTAPVASVLALAIRDNIAASALAGISDSPTRSDADTYTSRWARRALVSVVGDLSKDGQVSQELRKWRANFITNYRFTGDTILRGFGVGGAIRWQDKIATGYPILEVNEGVVTPDLANAFFGPAELNGDLWVTYERDLSEKIHWKAQLNVRNAFGDNSPIPVITNPDGRVAVIRNSNPQEFFLTNTFSF